MEKEKDPLYIVKRPTFAMLWALVIIALYVCLQVYPTKISTPLLTYPRLKLQDAFFKTRLLYNKRFKKDYSKEGAVTLIASDEESLSKLEIKQDIKYDAPLFTLLIERLSEYQPKIIVLDITFFNQGTYEGRPELIEAIKKAGNVFVCWDATGMGTMQQFDKDIMNASLGYGRVDIIPGTIDNIVRAYFPSGHVRHDVGRVMPLAIKAALAYQNMPFNNHFYHKGSNTILFASKKDVITLPLNEDKMIYINYLYDEKRIPTIPIWKAMEGGFDPDLLKGKIALVGMTADSYPDFHLTPIGRIPGCVILANQINSFVHSYLFSEVRKATQVFILTIFGLILAFLLYRNSMVRGLIILIGLICLAVVVSFALFLHNILWSAWHVIALSTLLYLVVLIHKASIWEVENKLLKARSD